MTLQEIQERADRLVKRWQETPPSLRTALLAEKAAPHIEEAKAALATRDKDRMEQALEALEDLL